MNARWPAGIHMLMCMCMKMDRRLQLLLDAARYERVAAEAERSGRSVAAVIREAIDVSFPVGDELRVQVAGALLASTAHPKEEPGLGPAELKSALEQDLADRLPSA